MNYLEKLQELFPNHWEAALNQVIVDVNSEMPASDDEEKLERMCTLLIENFSNQSVVTEENDDSSDGEAGANQPTVLIQQVLRRFPDACPKYVEKLLESFEYTLDFPRVVQHFNINGYIKKGTDNDNAELKSTIRELFPDACDIHVNNCIKEGLSLEAIIDKFSNEDYVKTSRDQKISSKTKQVHQRLCDMLPSFDPDFLLNEAKKLESNKANDAAISRCVDNLLQMEKFPTVEEYNKRQKKKQQMLKYLFHFKIDDFLKENSYSTEKFETKRSHSLQNSNNNADNVDLEHDRRFAKVILRNVYTQHNASFIDAQFERCNFDIIQCCNQLGATKHSMNEHEVTLPINSYNNKLMFQELGYAMHRQLINNYHRLRTTAEKEAYEEAKENKMLQTCKCCFANDLLLLPEGCYMCRNECVFCKECMMTGTAIAYGDGHLEIACFAACGADFSDETLHMVMDPVAFYKLMQRKQIKEIKDAQVDGFETCPFCDFGTVMDRDDKIFKCGNSECGKESCRECRHVSHIPLKCTEIEYDEDVKMRTYIENQMTAALVRTCPKCARQFIKEIGCNKMTCKCGTTLCYVCGASGINYNHFAVAGGCPQDSNLADLHRNNVLRGVQLAKSQLGVDKNPNKLKFDPSKNF